MNFIFCFIALVSILAETSLYEILGVDKRTSASKIKKAYRDLSLKLHPDKPFGDEAEFIKVSNAYEILSDKEKRKLYDSCGMECVEKGGKASSNPFDLFSQFGFGSFFGGGHRQEDEEEERAPDLVLDLYVSLRDIYIGKEFSLHVKTRRLCPHCHGSGAENDDDVVTCTKCKGNGIIITRQQLAPGFVQQMQTACPKCKGKGRITSSVCSTCKGHKLVPGDRTVEFDVLPGSPDGYQIILENEGEELPDMQPGHLAFILHTAQDDKFTRDGMDLHYDLSISLLEALTGFKKSFMHLDNHAVKVNREKITRPFEIIELKNEGLPKWIDDGPSDTLGSLFVHITVEFPSSLSQYQRDEIARIFPS